MKDVTIKYNRNINYCQNPPFHPSIKYPEYPFEFVSENNTIYSSLREIFFNLGYDYKNYDSCNWNPLKDFIQPGEHVFIKPNLVYHNIINDAIITHGSIIRPVLDYVYIALKGQGRITIGDSPVQGADFDEILTRSGLKSIVDFYKKNTDIELNIVDLRKEKVHTDILQKSILRKTKIRLDNTDYIAVDLGKLSEFMSGKKPKNKYKVSMYPHSELNKHHTNDKHEYLISKQILDADIIINLPKLKTHRIAGITCCLKNMIGINGDKNWIPHYTLGSFDEGGDEYLNHSFRKKLLAKIVEKIDSSTNRIILHTYPTLYYIIYISKFIINFKDPFFNGAWYGNDTIWRSTLDLNKIIFYADKQGIIRESQQRKMFILVDAIVAGEKEGPLKPEPKVCNLLIAGRDPLAVDLICCSLMGFDYQKIPTLNRGVTNKKWGLCSKVKEINCDWNKRDLQFDFEPASSWKGFIENKGFYK